MKDPFLAGFLFYFILFYFILFYFYFIVILFLFYCYFIVILCYFILFYFILFYFILCLFFVFVQCALCSAQNSQRYVTCASVFCVPALIAFLIRLPI
jgi:hypothetical protein